MLQTVKLNLNAILLVTLFYVSHDRLGNFPGYLSEQTTSFFFFTEKRPQYTSPRHPVVACALAAYDLDVSPLNECLLLSKGEGYGGLDCVLKTLEACTQEVSGEPGVGD